MVLAFIESPNNSSTSEGRKYFSETKINCNEDSENEVDYDSTESTIDNGNDNGEYELEGDTASDSEEELVAPKKSKKTK